MCTKERKKEEEGRKEEEEGRKEGRRKKYKA